SYKNVKPLSVFPLPNAGEGSSDFNKRSRPEDNPEELDDFIAEQPPNNGNFEANNPDFEDDQISVISVSTSKSKPQVPYRAKNYGPAVGAYRSSFRNPDGGTAIPGVLDHQRRADHFIQREKTHDATAKYTAKFNTTYNVTQGSATPPNPANVAATLLRVETNEKIAAYELLQHQKRQKLEKNQRFQANRETLNDRLDQFQEKLASLEEKINTFDQVFLLHNNYFAEIGSDNTKTSRALRRTNEAIHLVFEELSESVNVLDQVAKSANIETYDSVIDEKGLRKLIGKKPVYKESKGKEPAHRRETKDGDAVFTDAKTGKVVDLVGDEDHEEDV
ncbi:hypothetical protein HDU76_008756, partial [Blyttiomyces sp. JEL0837]